MTEYELNEFQSEFDPVALSESLQEDSSPQNKVKNFALLKTSAFLVFFISTRWGLRSLNNSRS